ncbi:MAG: hypothetical protein A2Y10_16850 [Planctomycetes bacterium GWF2_41_51]|nr:MAG: hypothetical protein A2Y10_16850 [Planctomycetes bacterium GWF2_41_51]HBG28863.1 hypothetical protein [Phycisphaerales bacterium]
MKILLFFSSGLGDALFIAPTYFALRELHPDSDITAIVPQLKHNAFLLQEIFKFDKVINLRRLRSFSPNAIISYMKYFYALSKNIRKQKYDLVIPTIEARLPDQYFLTFLSGAKNRIGPKYWYNHNNIFRFILTNQVYSSNRNMAALHFDLVRAIEKNVDMKRYIEKTKNVLLEASKDSNIALAATKMLVISPGSGSQPYKRWPFKNFIEVITYALANYNCDVAVVSGSGEYDTALIPQEIVNNPKFHNISDTLTLPQIIHLFNKANLIIGNDNGLLHLAEFLDKPTIGIYAGNWHLFSKRFLDNDRKHIVLPKNRTDILANHIMDKIWRNRKIQNIYSQTVNSVQVNDVIDEIKAALD